MEVKISRSKENNLMIRSNEDAIEGRVSISKANDFWERVWADVPKRVQIAIEIAANIQYILPWIKSSWDYDKMDHFFTRNAGIHLFSSDSFEKDHRMKKAAKTLRFVESA